MNSDIWYMILSYLDRPYKYIGICKDTCNDDVYDLMFAKFKSNKKGRYRYVYITSILCIFPYKYRNEQMLDLVSLLTTYNKFTNKDIERIYNLYINRMYKLECELVVNKNLDLRLFNAHEYSYVYEMNSIVDNVYSDIKYIFDKDVSKEIIFYPFDEKTSSSHDTHQILDYQ